MLLPSQAISGEASHETRLAQLGDLKIKLRSVARGLGDNCGELKTGDDASEELLVGRDCGELRELPDHVFGCVEEKPVISLAQHRGIVERISGGHDFEIERLEGRDGVAFLVGHAELVAGDAIICYDEPVTEKGRPSHLAHERLGELLESIGEDNHRGFFPEGGKKLGGAGEEGQPGDDLLDLAKRDAVLRQQIDAVEHEFVIIRLLPRRAAEFRDAGAGGDRDPDFWRQDAFHVEGDNALIHEFRRQTKRFLLVSGRFIWVRSAFYFE